MIERDWYGCYKEGWNGQITPDSFAHPAKFARGLIRRIYEHALEQGYLSPEDTVLDPFGGVALGACDAVREGLRWVGVELEQPFNDLGAGCDCTGINKEDWVRFYGRWDRVRYRNGRHWCPRCLSEAKQVVDGNGGQLSFFDSEPSAAYVRNSGQIPNTEPHHYTGNIELWQKQGYNGAQLLQGDSQELGAVLGEAGGVVSSPPYAKSNVGNNDAENELRRLQEKAKRGELSGEHLRLALQGRLSPNEQAAKSHYGSTPGQLANLPEGTPPDALVSSPPYADGAQHTGGETRTTSGQGGLIRFVDYGQTPGQLGSMRVVSSPPYAESVGSDDPDRRGGLYRDEKRHKDKTLTAEYGDSEGQLGRMRVVSSPPHCDSTAGSGKDELTLSKGLGNNYDEDLPYEKRGFLLGKDGYKEWAQSCNLGSFRNPTDDFWTAARQIMGQVYQVLPPGAHAIWVVKGFIRKKAYVDFPDQWRQLGEACGFETIEWIRAWLVEDRGTQYDLFGGKETKTVERKSFFRRLAESKGSPRIDYEVVLIQRRCEVKQC